MQDRKNAVAEELADRYAAVWNEPDADARSKAVAALWTEDGVHLLEPPEEAVKRAEELDVAATFEARGHAALVRRVARAYDEFVRPGEFEFRREGVVKVVRDMVKLRWVMVPAGGGEAVGGGTDVLLLAPDGRITADYQFID
ncbi:hypothetical protein AB0F43_02245 [Kribbella sp. NPDC023972]|uniref:hypothetical protein n=1 Tax=Kribbella sp. NPDC023972 TaxID=3154795 RepID=UPI0033E3A8F3